MTIKIPILFCFVLSGCYTPGIMLNDLAALFLDFTIVLLESIIACYRYYHVQMRKVRLRQIKQHAPGLIKCNEPPWDSNPDSLNSSAHAPIWLYTSS